LAFRKSVVAQECIIVTTNPTVSVVTANFNHGALIGDTVRSVAAQGESVIEHIIVDDASTDDSRDTIRDLREKYPLVRLIENERNMGPALSSGRGFREARGDYIQFLSADDVLPKHSIARRVDVAKAAGTPALICGDVLFTDAVSGASVRRRYIDVDKPTYISPADLVAQQRRALYVVNGGSALVRRKDLDTAGIDDPKLRWHCDIFAFNVIAHRHGLWYIPEVLHNFAMGEGGFSRGSRVWSRQEPVLSHIFELLQSEQMKDIRGSFKKSTILAAFPHILRYMAAHHQARDFLTPKLLLNALTFEGYRGFRNSIPDWLIQRRVGYLTRRLGAS
jgi:glycosyltransferase involved in cell wall biosynthesis